MYDICIRALLRTRSVAIPIQFQIRWNESRLCNVWVALPLHKWVETGHSRVEPSHDVVVGQASEERPAGTPTSIQCTGRTQITPRTEVRAVVDN